MFSVTGESHRNYIQARGFQVSVFLTILIMKHLGGGDSSSDFLVASNRLASS